MTQATAKPTRPAPPLPTQVWVTPEIAGQWLDLNKNNRKLRETRAQGFARDMINGDWDEAVVSGVHFVSEDGLLGDGQHRLRGVEISGRPQWFYVQTVNRKAIIKAVDRGTKRNVTDGLHFEGITANGVQAAIARKVLTLQAGFAPGAGGQYRPTDAEIHDILTGEHGPIIIEAERVASLIRREKGLSARTSAVGIAYYSAALIDHKGAQDFFVTQLAHSEGMTKLSPANALRRRMKNAEKTTMSDTEQFNYIVHAWNHYREGNLLDRLQAPRSWGPNGYAVAI